jgi:anti-sigma factor RsiW
MSAHLGHAVTAFIDGELDTHKRDEVLAHLTHCLSCRSEVDALRRLKGVLRTDAPAIPSDLAARLLATVVVVQPVMASPTGPARRRRPHVRRRPARHARLRRTAVGGALVALGLGGALSLAGPPPRGPVAPVDPMNASFIIDHGATSNEVPFTELDVVSADNSRSSR